MTHPIFGGAEDGETEVLTLMDELQALMGHDAYCIWLANETPLEWLTTTPAGEIAAAMRRKREEL